MAVIPVSAQPATPSERPLVIGQADMAYRDLDPASASAMIDMRLLRGLYETLVVHGEDGVTPEPGAAQSWTVSDDGLIYTFSLRDDATWSNGQPVTAHDFVAGWFRSLMPDTAADYVALHFVLDGARSFFDWRTEGLIAARDAGESMSPEERLAAWNDAIDWYGQSVGVEAVDAGTLRVTLAERCPYFLHLITMPNFAPFPAAQLLEDLQLFPNGLARIRPDYFTDPDRLVTNGVYRLQVASEERVVLNLSQHHPDAATAGFRSIIQRAYGSVDAMAADYEAGRIDWVPSAPDTAWRDRLLSENRPDVHTLTNVGTYYYQFNCRPTVDGRPNPFTDARLRRALAHTFDRDALAMLAGPTTRPLLTLTPPATMPGYDPPADAAAAFDLDEARRLLAAAGYNADRPVGPVTILTNDIGAETNTRHTGIARHIGACWAELGVGIMPTPLLTDFRTYLDHSNNGVFHARRAGWYADYSDPTAFLDLLSLVGGYQNAGYRSDAFEDLLADAAGEPDPAQRAAILREAEALLLHDAVIVPIYQYGSVMLYDADRLTIPTNAWMTYRLEHIRPLEP